MDKTPTHALFYSTLYADTPSKVSID